MPPISHKHGDLQLATFPLSLTYDGKLWTDSGELRAPTIGEMYFFHHTSSAAKLCHGPWIMNDWESFAVADYDRFAIYRDTPLAAGSKLVRVPRQQLADYIVEIGQVEDSKIAMLLLVEIQQEMKGWITG